MRVNAHFNIPTFIDGILRTLQEGSVLLLEFKGSDPSTQIARVIELKKNEEGRILKVVVHCLDLGTGRETQSAWHDDDSSVNFPDRVLVVGFEAHQTIWEDLIQQWPAVKVFGYYTAEIM